LHAFAWVRHGWARPRRSLEQPDRLSAWLCGIARNLARNARRKASRSVESAEARDVLTGLSDDLPGPAEEAVSREEEALVWHTLERISEAYREPLILFYSEDWSVAELAGALGLSEDAVTEPDLRRAADEIFSPARHAGAFISPVK
jgi:RNA polymerase sigma factor (sigma-70 family)